MRLPTVVREITMVLAGTGLEYEIIIVDDGSTDHTVQVAKELGLTVLGHSRNRGYGAALETGILAAKYDTICITDADGTYPAERIPDLLRALATNDMVVGGRHGEFRTDSAHASVAEVDSQSLGKLCDAVQDSRSQQRHARFRARPLYSTSISFRISSVSPRPSPCPCCATNMRSPICRSTTGGGSAANRRIVRLGCGHVHHLDSTDGHAVSAAAQRVPSLCARVYCVCYSLKLCWDLGITGDRNISTTVAVAMLSALPVNPDRHARRSPGHASVAPGRDTVRGRPCVAVRHARSQ